MRSSALIRLSVNGEDHALAVPAQRTLLEALRYDLGLIGSKQGCDKGDCGACTVLARPRGAPGRGEAILSCITLAHDAQDLEIVTIGQYLRPSADHTPMARYYHPDEFHELRQIALELGFVQVNSGPLVRSSYHAHETADSYEKLKVRR